MRQWLWLQLAKRLDRLTHAAWDRYFSWFEDDEPLTRAKRARYRSMLDAEWGRR